jgi:hypothetical protein
MAEKFSYLIRKVILKKSVRNNRRCVGYLRKSYTLYIITRSDGKVFEKESGHYLKWKRLKIKEGCLLTLE